MTDFNGVVRGKHVLLFKKTPGSDPAVFERFCIFTETQSLTSTVNESTFETRAGNCATPDAPAKTVRDIQTIIDAMSGTAHFINKDKMKELVDSHYAQDVHDYEVRIHAPTVAGKIGDLVVTLSGEAKVKMPSLASDPTGALTATTELTFEAPAVWTWAA